MAYGQNDLVIQSAFAINSWENFENVEITVVLFKDARNVEDAALLQKDLDNFLPWSVANNLQR